MGSFMSMFLSFFGGSSSTDKSDFNVNVDTYRKNQNRDQSKQSTWVSCCGSSTNVKFLDQQKVSGSSSTRKKSVSFRDDLKER